MIQINLIPDVKQELLAAQRMRRTAISISIFVGIAAAGAVVALGLILGAQTLYESHVRGEITKKFNELSSIPNINEVLTIQNQLSSIQDLHDQRSMTSRLFDVLSAINPPAPNSVRFSSVQLDPEKSVITIEGSAQNGFAATETFRKTVLNTTIDYGVGNETKSEPLTTNVTIGETSYGEAANGNRVLRFTVSFEYPKGLFDNTLRNIRVITPTSEVDVTDSKNRVPESLFSEQATDIEEGQ